MKHIIKAIRKILAIPFIAIGSVFYWLGEKVAGELYARRKKEIELEVLNGMNRKEYRAYLKGK